MRNQMKNSFKAQIKRTKLKRVVNNIKKWEISKVIFSLFRRKIQQNNYLPFASLTMQSSIREAILRLC